VGLAYAFFLDGVAVEEVNAIGPVDTVAQPGQVNNVSFTTSMCLF
jgi:hypothetical protein